MDGSFFDTLVQNFRTRFMGKEVTMYPTYGYQDPAHPDHWLVPLRIWVHDNIDTPFVEDLFERVVARHFAEDLARPLTGDELARLEHGLEHFIAEDKEREELEIVLPGEGPITLEGRTGHNGVLEITLHLPEEQVERVRAAGGSAWTAVQLRTRDGLGTGTGVIRFLEPEGLSVVSDIDDTIKISEVPAGKKRVLRNVFLHPYRAAPGMRERYEVIAAAGENVCFHYVSGSPWQLFNPLREFLLDEQKFPSGTFHMKNLTKNLLEPGALKTIRGFALGGDLATLDQKIRQITRLILHLPRRRFILVGDSGERDPEIYRAIQRLFPRQIERIIIRDVLGSRLEGMERISGPDVSINLDTTEVETEMAALIAETSEEPIDTPGL